MTTKTAKLARSFADAFETAKRDNGEEFFRLREGSPDWMRDAIFSAHGAGEMLPNDWSYRLCSSMADGIAEALESDDSADLDDLLHEIADGAVPVYTGQRLAWLASHLGRLAMVDDAFDEAGARLPEGQGIADVIGWGIHRECETIGHAIIEALREEAGEL